MAEPQRDHAQHGGGAGVRLRHLTVAVFLHPRARLFHAETQSSAEIAERVVGQFEI